MQQRLVPRPRTRLRKWYADVVTPDGALAICYVATLSAGRVRVHYSAVLESEAPGAPLRQRQRWRAGRVVDGDEVGVDLPALGAAGTWGAGVGTQPQTIVQTDAGRITWQALRLAAPVTLTTPARTYAGTGYAEVVEVTLPPWQVPLRDLAWGRFVADDGTLGLTWIVADGLAFAATGPATCAIDPDLGTVNAGRVRSADDSWTLRWDGAQPIRRELVHRTILGRFAPLAAFLPRGLRGLHEDKRLSRGAYTDAGRTSEGWVVHERVAWL